MAAVTRIALAIVFAILISVPGAQGDTLLPGCSRPGDIEPVHSAYLRTSGNLPGPARSITSGDDALALARSLCGAGGPGNAQSAKQQIVSLSDSAAFSGAGRLAASSQFPTSEFGFTPGMGAWPGNGNASGDKLSGGRAGTVRSAAGAGGTGWSGGSHGGTSYAFTLFGNPFLVSLGGIQPGLVIKSFATPGTRIVTTLKIPLGPGGTTGTYSEPLQVEPVPEPASLLLLASGLGSLGVWSRSRPWVRGKKAGK